MRVYCRVYMKVLLRFFLKQHKECMRHICANFKKDFIG